MLIHLCRFVPPWAQQSPIKSRVRSDPPYTVWYDWLKLRLRYEKVEFKEVCLFGHQFQLATPHLLTKKQAIIASLGLWSVLNELPLAAIAAHLRSTCHCILKKWHILGFAASVCCKLDPWEAYLLHNLHVQYLSAYILCSKCFGVPQSIRGSENKNKKFLSRENLQDGKLSVPNLFPISFQVDFLNTADWNLLLKYRLNLALHELEGEPW